MAAAALSLLGAGSRALSALLGALALALAAAALATAEPAASVIDRVFGVLGFTFTGLLAALALIALTAWVRLLDGATREEGVRFWHATGLHAANGVATLALTFTLLGISLGIGGLAERELTPATVQEVIRGLCRHFSLAFSTTVIGLPVAALLRALVTLTALRRQRQRAPYA